MREVAEEPRIGLGDAGFAVDADAFSGDEARYGKRHGDPVVPPGIGLPSTQFGSLHAEDITLQVQAASYLAELLHEGRRAVALFVPQAPRPCDAGFPGACAGENGEAGEEVGTLGSIEREAS